MTHAHPLPLVPIVSAEHSCRYWELMEILAALKEGSTLYKKYLFDLLMIPTIAKSRLHPDEPPVVFLEALRMFGASQANIQIVRCVYREAYDLMVLHDMRDRAQRQGRLVTFLNDARVAINHMTNEAMPFDPANAFESHLAHQQIPAEGWQAAFPKWQRLTMMKT